MLFFNGTQAPNLIPYFQRTPQNRLFCIKLINISGADVLFVGVFFFVFQGERQEKISVPMKLINREKLDFCRALRVGGSGLKPFTPATETAALSGDGVIVAAALWTTDVAPVQPLT